MTWFLKDKELKFFFRLLHSPSSARPSGLNYCGATSGAVPSHLSLQDWAGYLFISTPLCPVFTSAITCHYYYFFLIIILFILFLAVLGLRFCVRVFSSCGEWGPLFIAMRGPLTIAASLVVEHRLQTRRLSSCGSWA